MNDFEAATLRRRSGAFAAALLVYGIAAALGNTAHASGFGPVDPFAAIATTPATAAAADAAPADLRQLATGTLKAFLVHGAPQPLPEFAFVDEAGVRHSLAEFRGKLVLLNLWATWCGPCRHEMPAFDELQRRLAGRPFAMLSISIDRGGLAKSRRFFDEYGVRSLTLYGDADGRLAPSLKAFAMPTTLLIDAEGREIGRMAGPAEWASTEAVAFLEAALKQAGLAGKG